MIVIISKNRSFIEHISKLELEFEVETDFKNIQKYSLAIVEDEDVLQTMVFNNVNVLVVSSKPIYKQGMSFLQKGARGYGNSFMSLVHFHQAINTIKNQAIWLNPELMNQLIQSGSKNITDCECKSFECLSQREKEVALEIQEGKSNKEIANSLEITERTVKAHLSHIFEKLDVHDRFALAMLLRA